MDAWKFLLNTDCKSSVVLWSFTFLASRKGIQSWDESLFYVPEILCWVWIDIRLTKGGYHLVADALTLDLFSSNCCRTLLVYSVKADLDPEEMVVFVLSVSLAPLVDVSVLHVSVIWIAETEAGPPVDLSYLNLNCFSKVRGSTDT